MLICQYQFSSSSLLALLLNSYLLCLLRVKETIFLNKSAESLLGLMGGWKDGQFLAGKLLQAAVWSEQIPLVTGMNGHLHCCKKAALLLKGKDHATEICTEVSQIRTCVGLQPITCPFWAQQYIDLLLFLLLHLLLAGILLMCWL